MTSEAIEFIARFFFFEAMYVIGYLIGYRQGKNDGGSMGGCGNAGCAD